MTQRQCSEFHTAVELIGRRWNGVVLQAMLDGCRRFSEIRAEVPGITDAMLSQRLRGLESAGLVVREVGEGRPVDIRYSLTPIGRRLAPVIEAITAWGVDWLAETGGAEQEGKR